MALAKEKHVLGLSTSSGILCLQPSKSADNLVVVWFVGFPLFFLFNDFHLQS